ncbi:hypothetical protein BCR35DRAFT_305709 [Leucosporidium creatinivorum]|uniref:Zn(2)-C6 fungal-type domain-containing protein n=1 Tax=Leucosporidium creatinivorum TaxID=106004 RepID=A0A1Y2F1W1_9BASI|nr:hypothetical protein BCR35DRAFT_305709 [Leucosporidium creatinivorum]
MPPKSCTTCIKRKITCRWVSSTSSSCSTCLARNAVCPGRPGEEALSKKWTRARRGKLLEDLRGALGTPSPPMRAESREVGFSSPGTMLARRELAASLGYHLVLCAQQLGERWFSIPGSTLDPLVYQLQSSKPRPFSSAPLDPTLQITSARLRRPPVFAQQEKTRELAYACFSAYGARWSEHSAIVGPSPTSAAGEAEAVWRREGACYSLIDRAVAIAEEASLFDLRKQSFKHARALNFLRQTISVVAPTHPSLPRVIHAVHALRNAPALPPSPEDTNDHSFSWAFGIVDVPIADARYALRSHTACQLTDTDLLQYAWSPSLSQAAAKRLQFLSPRPWREEEMDPIELYMNILAVKLGLLRSLVGLRMEGDTYPPLLLYTSYTALADQFTTLLTFFDAKACQLFLLARDPALSLSACSTSPEAQPSILHFEATAIEGTKVGWLDLLVKHLGQLMSFASFACSAVERIGTERLGMVEKEELRERFERVLLWSLKRLLDSRTFMGNNEPLRLFDAAPTLSVLDPEYNWLQLAVSATDPFSPYSDLGLTVSELGRLQLVLDGLAPLYAVVAQQAEALRLALALASITNTPMSDSTVLSTNEAQAQTQMQGAGEEVELSRKIVDSTLCSLTH